jgi:hypothetical protein
MAPDEGQAVPAAKGEKIPPHLTDLIKRVRKSAPKSVRAEIGNLLIEYKDIFASHEFDLGNFRTVEYKIDTRNAPLLNNVCGVRHWASRKRKKPT